MGRFGVFPPGGWFARRLLSCRWTVGRQDDRERFFESRYLPGHKSLFQQLCKAIHFQILRQSGVVQEVSDMPLEFAAFGLGEHDILSFRN